MDHPAMRVSDEEREEAIGLLHGHLLAGRIDSDELEDRIGEACGARTFADLDHAFRGLPERRQPAQAPVPPVFVAPRETNSSATISLVLSILSLCLLVFFFGVLSIVCLPLSATAWVLGRDARRSIAETGQAGAGTARAGEVLGIVGTVLSSSGLVACAAFVTSNF